MIIFFEYSFGIHLEDLLNEVNPESGEFFNNEDVIKDYIINLQTSKENKLNNIEDLKLELKAQILKY